MKLNEEMSEKRNGNNMHSHFNNKCIRSIGHFFLHAWPPSPIYAAFSFHRILWHCTLIYISVQWPELKSSDKINTFFFHPTSRRFNLTCRSFTSYLSWNKCFLSGKKTGPIINWPVANASMRPNNRMWFKCVRIESAMHRRSIAIIVRWGNC